MDVMPVFTVTLVWFRVAGGGGGGDVAQTGLI